ncbi:exopolysaccharide biosynthesis polyprenyl glycosylphosphotransferase [Corynebacterium halotolerans]|uniref:exopolysaccharide biosynthesis polyprenyl glycosylphosphotransferase n=1 Tax=Corynebacterium halotolerans TaxID=225326 RepID=UPI00034701CA|nr:exopolysaccharide biosynthesis polyprenyl glycosylphosphotransferase [Corynebacterium halotolerans]
MVTKVPETSPHRVVDGDTAVAVRDRSRWPGILGRYLPDPWQRLADCLIVLTVCAVADLTYPLLTAVGILLILTVVPRLYRFRLGISVLDELPRLLVVGTIAPYVASSVLNPELSSFHDVVFSLVTAGGLVFSRVIVAALLRARRRRNPAVLSRTLILGCCSVARQLCRDLKNTPTFGLLPVALIDRDPEPGPDIPGLSLEPLEDNLPELIRKYSATTVIIAFSRCPDDHLLTVLRSCVREEAELYLVPRLPEYHAMDNATEMIGAIPLRHVPRAAHRSLTWFLKRPFDLLVSGLALWALSPLLLVLAVLVKLDTRTAPVLFRQERIGLDGKPFELLKFRTLTPADPGESDSRWNIAGDARLTPLGAAMRRFSLDELPQLYNVFRGDMTLVGPRPERPYFVHKFGQELPGYHARHRVPVGLTGWAAINGFRGDTSIRDRVLYDNYYIENWSPWLDVKVLLLTVRAVVGGNGG